MDKEQDSKWFDKETRLLLQTLNNSFSVKPSVVERYWSAVEGFSRQEVSRALADINANHKGQFSPPNLKAATKHQHDRRMREEEYRHDQEEKPFEYTAGTDAAQEASMEECRRLLAQGS